MILDFQSGLMDESVPIAIQFDSKSSVLLLIFSGLAQRINMPFFEFNNITGGLDHVNKIYLRDTYRFWYHRGLPNVGNDIDEIANFLRQYTTHPSTRKTVIFGNSGGGYAALLFGHILGVDEVHAFSPKLFIDPIKRVMNNDFPPKTSISHLFSLYLHGQRKYFDLQKVFLSPVPQKGNFHIYYSKNNKIDHLQAKRMKSIPGIHLHPFQHDRHNLIKLLKRRGKLRKIIEKAILISE